MIKTFSTSTFYKNLDVDSNQTNLPRQVERAHHSNVAPVGFENAELIHVSKEFAKELGFSKEDLDSAEFKELVTGNANYNGTSFAMNYGGHQFGNWAGQLGDGRAINIGQIIGESGMEQLQLKGAGPTPYSRRGDGYAVLRSSIREHLCSEAMHYLGISTTRSLSLALTGNDVYRDMFYDGNAAYEKGAVVCRVSPSFIRFGNFQIHAVNGELEQLRQLADFTIDYHFPEIDGSAANKYVQLFQTVASRTLTTIMHWQRVGFVHGVMNTDNMSILGLTIDYGPYGWLDNYDPSWTPNTTDNQHKRYRYGAQPEIGLWNLWQLANALFSLIEESEPLEAILNNYKKEYEQQRLVMMRSKLGLQKESSDDSEFIAELLQLLVLHETDMTIFFRELIVVNHETNNIEALDIIEKCFYDFDQMSPSVLDQWTAWFDKYLGKLKKESAFAKARTQQMQLSNPKYVLRNYIAQLVIEQAETGNYQLLNEVHEMLKKPYTDQPAMDHWYVKRPDWARNKPGSSQLSCSS